MLAACTFPVKSTAKACGTRGGSIRVKRTPLSDDCKRQCSRAIHLDGCGVNSMSLLEQLPSLCKWCCLLFPILVPPFPQEITRRVNQVDIWQAAYTAGVLLPKPVATCRYYHRSLNPKKLIDVGFSRLSVSGSGDTDFGRAKGSG